MKRTVKKSLSVLLAIIMASAMFVTAFAAAGNSEEIIYFDLGIDYDTNEIYAVYFDVAGYSVLNAESFACSIFDSNGIEIFDESMCDIETYLPEDLDFEEEYEVIWVALTVNDIFVVNPDETYTLMVAAGSFSSASQQLSPELTYDFLPSDYIFIYIPTFWDKVLFVLRSNPILMFVFAPLIQIIEFFYYGPWFPMPMFI
jgi:hypothetical protein